MSNPFDSPRQLLNDAKEALSELQDGFSAYLDSYPYSHLIEHDAETGRDTHIIRVTQKIPNKLARATYLFAIDLRSCLDQLAYAAALASGNTRLRYTYFPFANSATKLDEMIGGRCKDVPADIRAVFRSFNPYRGGDDVLWALNEIANCRKHRIVIPMAQGIGGMAVKHFRCKGRVYEMAMPPRWDTTKNQVVLCVVASNAETQYDMNLAFYVAFGKIDVVQGRPVVETFAALIGTVESIIDATIAKAHSIGFI